MVLTDHPKIWMVNEKNPTQYISTSQSNSVPLNATTKNIFLYIKIPNIGHYTTSHAIFTVFLPSSILWHWTCLWRMDWEVVNAMLHITSFMICISCLDCSSELSKSHDKKTRNTRSIKVSTTCFFCILCKSCYSFRETGKIHKRLDNM